MKNTIITQYQMRRAERKKWIISAVIVLLAFSVLTGVFFATRTEGVASAATTEEFTDIETIKLFPAGDYEQVPLTHDSNNTTIKTPGVFKVDYSAFPLYESKYGNFNILQLFDYDIRYKFIYENETFYYVGKEDLRLFTVKSSIDLIGKNYNEGYRVFFLNRKSYSGHLSNTDKYISLYFTNDSTDRNVYVELNNVGENIFGYIPSVSVEDPEAPEGYYFVGWYYDEAFTNPYKEGDVITEDTNLYAKFQKETYKITYVVNGEQYVTAEVAYGDPINNTVPTGINDTNVFSGWFTDKECTQAFDFTKTADADITLYSTIQLKKYDVKFFVNGELYATIKVPHGYTLVRLANSSESDASTAAALLSAFEFEEGSEVDANTEITEDTEVNGKLSEKAEKWINAGTWLEANWPWVAATAGAVVIIIAGSVLVSVFKRK